MRRRAREGQEERPAGRFRWRRLLWVAGPLLVLLIGFWTPFVWFPRSDAPGTADVVFVLGGTNMNVRVRTGADLVRQGHAPYLVVSRSDPDHRCEEFADLAGTEMECDRPEPFTTQGEARLIARLAREHGWHSIIAVVSDEQATRARIRLRRCWSGGLRVVTVSTPLTSVPYTTLYETAAMVKAEVLQRGC